MSSSASPDFGRLALAYDDVRPADANWREVVDLVVDRAGLRNARVLDIGCGTGRLAVALAAEGARVWGVDASPEMLEVARGKKPRGAEFRVARAEQLPFRAGWFERAVFWLVVHLVDRPRAFAEAKRVLAPDGRVAVVTFDPSHFDRHWLNRFFPSLEAIDRARFPRPDELAAELAGAGFAGVELERVSRRASLTRDEALRRVSERHISTFDLLPPEEVDEGTERAARELPDTVEYPIEWLVAFARA